MKDNMDVLKEIPCFKCLFWDWKKESHLYCNPNNCEILTKWLLKETESCGSTEENLTFVRVLHVKDTEKSSE